MNKKDILDLAQREKRDEGEDAMENKSRRIGSLAVIFLCLCLIILNNHFKKAYAEEDEIKRKAAEIRRQAEAEKERQRQLRREQNPDGIVGDVSKKKLRQQAEAADSKRKILKHMRIFAHIVLWTFSRKRRQQLNKLLYGAEKSVAL